MGIIPYSILRTKLFPPQTRPGLVLRQQLLERFIAGLGCPLTLLSAPAGYGKSTLLAMWAEKNRLERERGQPGPQGATAWLSLDSYDSDPSRFWIYLLAALKYAGEIAEQPLSDQFDQLIAFIQSGQQPSIDFVDSLINTIIQAGRLSILVLEDYHVIQASEIHDSLTYLLGHLPPNLRLVIATRIDPPLPLPRLRGRGELSELRAADFRFNSDEVALFFKDLAGYELSLQDAVDIDRNIEGWPAGLHMAALAFQAHRLAMADEERSGEQLRRFMENLSGKHGFIIDYLADEVFNRQPWHVRNFLLKTSVLERMCAPLCAALLQGEGAGGPGSGEILAYLEQANLFIIPLDSDRNWYRYHHLFADLLKARLNHAEPGLIPELHRCASRWYEQENMIGEAVLHAQKAADLERAAVLMENYHEHLIDRGELATISRWVETLPVEFLRRRPLLCVQLAWALAFAGKVQRIDELLRYAGAAMSDWEAFQAGTGEKPPFEVNSDQVVRIRAFALLPKGYTAIISGHPADTLGRAETALQALQVTRSKEAAYLNWLAGFACRAMGDLDRAVEYQSEAIAIGRTMDTAIETLLFQTELGDIYRLQGKLPAAQSIFRDTLEWVQSKGTYKHGFVSRVEAYLSSVLLEQNLLEEALLHARRALELLSGWPNHNYMATAYINYGLALLASGDMKGAEEYILHADRERNSAPVDLRMDVPVTAGLMRLWLAKSDWQAAEQLAHDLEVEELQGGPSINEFREKKLIALARFRLARARLAREPALFDEATRLLVTLEQAAQLGGRVHSLIETGVLKAMAQYLRAGLDTKGPPAPGHQNEALGILEEALARAAGEGYIRIFVNEGQIMAGMLKSLLHEKYASAADPYPCASEAYLHKLLKAFPPEVVPVKEFSVSGMIETLTDRELEVLHMLGQGLSNKGMAQRLYLSEGTVKTHVHNVLGKLGAQSRTQAVARGRELNLL